MKNNINDTSIPFKIVDGKLSDNKPFKEFDEKVKSIHKDLVDELQLPKWIGEIKCPFCKEKLTDKAIRGINFKTNPRNFGDLCFDFLCPSCRCGDSMYIRKAFSSKQDIAEIISGSKTFDPETAFVEEKMYTMCYNNTIEKFMGGENGNT